MSNSLKDDCYELSNGHCFCIEFRADKRQRGFLSSHLIEYTLEENPDAKNGHVTGDKATPPERLALAFSTADVTILGWRLGRLVSLLHENKLAIVGIHPKSPNELDANKPCVTSITISPIAKP